MIEGVNKAVDAARARLELIKSGRAQFFAATGTMVDVSKRVWDRGELTDGGTLQYSGPYELYAYTPPMPRKVSGKGKPFAQWKDQDRAKAIQANQGGDARKIKGGFYNSWQDLKQDQGRGDKPFELTGRLRKAYLSGLLDQGEQGLLIHLSGEEAAKYEGLTDTKGRFLQLNQDEIKGYGERLIEFLNEQ